jgi:transposase
MNAQARQRATLILQVQAGQITASEAARQLGMSRKTYYQWERRALEGLMQGLKPGSPGRPSTQPSRQVQHLRRKVEELEAKLAKTEKVARLRELIAEAKRPQPTVKKRRSSRRSSK